MERIEEARDFPPSRVIWSIACRSHQTGQHQNQEDKRKSRILIKKFTLSLSDSILHIFIFVYFFKSSQFGHLIGKIKRGLAIFDDSYKSIRGKFVRKRNQRDNGIWWFYTLYIYFIYIFTYSSITEREVGDFRSGKLARVINSILKLFLHNLARVPNDWTGNQ